MHGLGGQLHLGHPLIAAYGAPYGQLSTIHIGHISEIIQENGKQ